MGKLQSEKISEAGSWFLWAKARDAICSDRSCRSPSVSNRHQIVECF